MININKINKNPESGMILVVVLMLLGIMAGLAVSLISAEKSTLGTTQSLMDQAQAAGYLKGAEIWAGNILKTDIYNSTPALRFPLTMPAPQPKIPGADIKAVLFDAQGSFYNINNLSVKENTAGFKYWISAQTGQPGPSIEDFIQQIIFWISPNKNTHSSDGDYYLNLPVPYRASHQFLVSISELSVIKYFDKSTYQSIMPYLIALPEVTPVNINTASLQILSTLGTGIPLDKAQQLAAARERMQAPGFETTAVFLSQPGMEAYHITDQQITIKSLYFLLETQITNHQHFYKFYTLFSRAEDQDNSRVQILWERQGY